MFNTLSIKPKVRTFLGTKLAMFGEIHKPYIKLEEISIFLRKHFVTFDWNFCNWDARTCLCTSIYIYILEV